MITINGNCTPSISIDIEFDENPNELPVVWLKTGYKQGVKEVNAPLNKKAVQKLITELHKMYIKM